MSREFITEPSFVPWAVGATTGWCKGMMPVTCGDAAMLGRKPSHAGEVVESAGVPWLCRCHTWQAGDCC